MRLHIILELLQNNLLTHLLKMNVYRYGKEICIMKWLNLVKDNQASAVSTAQKAAYLYLVLPIFIFFAFWLKPVYSLPSIILILAALVRILLRKRNNIHKINWDSYKKLAFCLFIICIWVYFSGIGKFVYQNSDHPYRNAMFTTLVKEHWPVIYESLGDYSDRPLALVYYFAFWLPSAVVGKIFSMESGFTFQAVWAAAGIFLAFCLFCEIRGKIQIRDLVIFMLFSGLDIIRVLILKPDAKILSVDHIEYWNIGMQYSSFTTQLFWVFNQAVPAWLITALILVQKDRRTLVFIYSFSVLSCTFPAVGMIPILAYQAVVCGYEPALNWKNNIVKLIKDICTWENVICGGIIGMISYLFLHNNSSSQMREVAHLNATVYLLFLFCEVFFYFLLLHKYCSKCGLYYICILSLVLIPFVRIGGYIDFCMRASIPALYVLYLYVTQVLDKCLQKKDYLTLAALVVTLSVGSITPLHEYMRTIQNTVSGNLNQSEAELFQGTMPNNFFGYADDSIFFKYLVSDR